MAIAPKNLHALGLALEVFVKILENCKKLQDLEISLDMVPSSKEDKLA